MANVSFMRYFVPAAVLVLGGCAAESSDSSHVLGIEQFETVDHGNVTSIIGLDASGAEVGRVEILHGVYAASPEFADDFSSPTVDGRTLTVKVGAQSYHWETEGYAPTLSLPAAPGKMVAIGTFLEAPEVVGVMNRWGIGFEHFVAEPPRTASALDGETAYLQDCGDGYLAPDLYWMSAAADYGSGGQQYSSVSSVTLPNNESAGTCGGSVAASSLGMITTTLGGVTQYAIQQQCTSSGETRLYRKTCPAGTDTVSQCGNTSGACVGCGSYTNALNSVTYYDAHNETVLALSIAVTSTSVIGSNQLRILCN